MNYLKATPYLICNHPDLCKSANALSPTPIAPNGSAIWKNLLANQVAFLRSQYQSLMTIFTPADPIHQAMAHHAGIIQKWNDELESMPLPNVFRPREFERDAKEPLHLESHLETITVMVHGSAVHPASLAAKPGMEKCLQSMMSGEQRTGKFAFITEGSATDANQHWVTHIRDPDYHIANSKHGQHSIHFSGTNATVGGGHFGHSHLLASEDLVNHHQGDELTIHWPMEAIFLYKETIDAISLTGLTLHDLFLHYQSNLSQFLDRMELCLGGDPRFDWRPQPHRLLSRNHTPYRIEIQINGVTQRTFGPLGHKRIQLNLASSFAF